MVMNDPDYILWEWAYNKDKNAGAFVPADIWSNP